MNINFPMHLLEEPPPVFAAGESQPALKLSRIDRQAPLVLLYQTLIKLGHTVGLFPPGECEVGFYWTGKNVPEGARDSAIILEVGWIPRWSYQVSPLGSNFQGHYARQYRYVPLEPGEEQWTRHYLGKLRQLFEQSLDQDKVERLRRQLKTPFVLFPFQLANDFNLKHSHTEFARFYSPEPDQNAALAQACIDKMEAESGLPPVVYKRHPFDFTTNFRGQLKTRGVVLDHADDVSTHELFATGLCQGVVSINSNSLHEAAAWNIPCFCLGKLIWNKTTPVPPFSASLAALRDPARCKPADNPITFAYLFYLLRHQWVLTDFQNGLMVAELLKTKGLCEPYALRKQFGLYFDPLPLAQGVPEPVPPLPEAVPDTPPPPASSENAPEVDPAEKQFVDQLATFFNAASLLRVDWESATRVCCHGFTAGGDRLATPSVEEPATRLPFKDGEFDTVFNFASLNCLDEAALDVWLAELRRVAGRNLWLALEPAPGRERVWWEKRLMEAGFRKHPLSLAVVPFEQIEREESQLTLLFEKIPAPALERYPLAALKAERDLHMDMLREPGIRSDAHLARYELARQYLKPGMVVLDAACGLGYGSAHLAAGTGVARVIGVDCSDYAVAYATANYAAEGGKVEFHAADATQLTWLADGSVDLVVSFETLEHLQNPEVLLREFFRVLRPGGTIIASVPNRWVDEQGNNPIPWHFQIYDFGRFRDELARHFQAAQFYRQNAGGGFHRPQPRILQALTGAPTESDDKDAEWWIAAARKPLEQSLPVLVSPAQTPPRIVVLDEEQRYEELYGQVFERLGVRPMSGFNRSVEEVLAMKPDAILLSREWTYTWRLIAAAARRANVPVIYVMDGVIEWSYVWNNLTFVKPEGTVLQPLLASHLSVIGRHPARILAGLGLADRTHLVGLPRLDRSARAPRNARGQKPKLLISTAKAPGHNTEHKVLVRRALRDLKQWFDQNPFVTPVWRIADQYAGDIGVRAERAGTFQEALAEVSGVLSFTSTCLLEAMLQGVPTAQVDYRAVPLYVQTAWEVRSAEHIPGVIQELLYPPPEKLALQEQCFEDEVEPGDASERLAQVILGAIAEARDPGAKTAAPAAAGCGPLDFHQVHSQLSAFSGSLQASLQYELDALQNLYDRARYELDLTRQHAGRLETQAREREQAVREMECRGREREQAIRDLTALRQEQEQIIQELRQLCAQQQRTIGQLDQPRGERAAAAPGDHGANGHLTAEDYLREAEAAGQQGEADTARQLLQTAIQRWPARAQFQDALGNLEWQCGDFAAAYEAYARAAALPPQSAAAFLKAALAAKAMGKPAACEAALMAVFQFEPANREAANTLAFLRLEQGRYGEAARMLEKLLDESPDDLNALLGLVKCQYKQGDLVGARLDCLRALKLDPENAVARESLAILNAPPAGAGPAPDARDLREKFRDAAEQVLEWNPRGQTAAANGANSQTTHVEGRTYGM